MIRLFLLLLFALSIVIFGNIDKVYSYSNIAIVATLKEGTFIESNLYFPENGTSFTFGGDNKLCPNNTCKYQFTDATFDTSFGSNDRDLTGTLKVQDMSNSHGNSISYKYYKVLGTMSLVETKEVPATGVKIDTYSGDLSIDTKDPIFFPAYRYKSQVIYNENSNMFNLHGVSK